MEDCIVDEVGAPIRSGHKQVKVNGRNEYVHRLAWAKANGPIPPGVKIRHTCDNPPCINPAHLLAGTQADNVADMDERGRRNAARGMDASNRKVTEDDVRAIRASADSLGVLAERYGMTKQGIALIIKRKNWKHVA